MHIMKIELLRAEILKLLRDSEVAVTAVKRVIEQGADLLIGGFSSGATLADQVPAIEGRVTFHNNWCF